MFRAATVASKGPFSRRRGRQLSESLLKELGEAPRGCWLFCAPGKGFRDMVVGVCEALGNPVLVGCTTDGEISGLGFSAGSAVLAGIVSEEIGFHAVSVEGLESDPMAVGRELGRLLPASVRHVQVFSDGITGNGCALLRGIASVLGPAIPISGGTAGDAGKFLQTWQFIGPRVLSDAVVAIGLTGDFSIGTGVRSGWSPIGIAKKVTRASGNVVYELNGQPALEVYERFLGKHADNLPAVGVEYPLGIVGVPGDPGSEEYCLLRATMSVNREEGSIAFAGEISEGAMVRLTCGDSTSILEATEKAARLALAELAGGSPAMVFFYSCMARKIVLGRRTSEEVERIRSVFGPDLPIIGFYTYGEYCRIDCEGPNLFHNETATVSVIGI